MYMRLKKEARQYIELLHEEKKDRIRPQGGTVLFFGDRDVLTSGYRKKYVRWKKYIAGEVSIRNLRGAYHFCLSSHTAQIVKTLLETGE